MAAYWREVPDWSWSKFVFTSLNVGVIFLFRGKSILSILDKLKYISMCSGSNVIKDKTNFEEVTV
jgi:hypothetical protein